MSGRISAASRSTSVTPKIPTKVVPHNSTMDAHNSTASSGSHVLNTDATVSPSREQGDARSVDSSLSGSHSLNSPKLDRQRSHEGTPGIDISLEHQEEDLPMAETPDDRGANFVVTNANINDSVPNTNEKLSANQNANDSVSNEAELRPYSPMVDDGKGATNTVSESDVVGGGGKGNSDDTNPQVTGNTNTQMHDVGKTITGAMATGSSKSRFSSLGRESKKVVFAADVKNDNDSEISDKSDQVTNNAGKLVIKFNEEVPAGACITVSVDVSPIHSNTPSLLVENDSDKNMSVAPNNVSDDLKDVCKETKELENVCQESAAASGEITLKEETSESPHGASQQGEATEGNGNDDLIEDIPYYLQRRHFEHETIEEIENELNSNISDTGNFTSNFRRGRSSRKRRPINMQVEHVKVYEGSTERSPSRESTLPRSPSSDKEHYGKHSRSPSGKRSPSASSRSPSASKRDSSRTSLDRSPSCNRRVEVINFHKLPPKDSYSSVDDTTSPTLEKDILQQIYSKKLIKSENAIIPNGDIKQKHTVEVVEHYLTEANVTKRNAISIDKSCKEGPVEHLDISVEMPENQNDKVDVESVEAALDKKVENVPITIDLTETPPQTVIDFESPAAAFLMANNGHSKKSNRNSITFSTFKPEESSNPSTPGSRPTSQVLEQISDNQSETDYGSLPSAKHADGHKPPQFALPVSENIFRPTRPNVQVSKNYEKRDGEIIHVPGRPRKVSFHRERGYTYSFESVNDPPSFALAEPLDDGRIDVSKSSSSDSPGSDVLAVLDTLDDNEDMIESDTESCPSCSDSESPSERESSDDEDVKHDEFLKFAKSLADSGKEITVDSGVGVDLNDNSSNAKSSPLDPLESLENLDSTRIEEEEKNVYNSRKDSHNEGNNQRTVSKSYTDSSLSSCDYDQDRSLRGKRVSLDPLSDLEKATLAEVESFSDSSGEEEGSGVVTERKVLPVVTVSSASSPDEPMPNSQGV